ncbi:hypothetical protein HDU96_006434 [Phlyctochytrium bullatum]|nr:hypothetical protein HDU96_006434 [Phlyctochytrium bullatum]
MASEEGQRISWSDDSDNGDDDARKKEPSATTNGTANDDPKAEDEPAINGHPTPPTAAHDPKKEDDENDSEAHGLTGDESAFLPAAAVAALKKKRSYTRKSAPVILEGGPMSAYELEREARIRQNRELLMSLQMLDPQEETGTPVETLAKPKRTYNKRKPEEPPEIVRLSRRIRGEQPEAIRFGRSKRFKLGNEDPSQPEFDEGVESEDIMDTEQAKEFLNEVAKDPIVVAAPFSLQSVKLTVWDLGKVVVDPVRRPWFWSQRGCRYRHQYPVGFRATKTQFGRDWTMTIEDGREVGPIFVVESNDGHVFKGTSPTRPWTDICIQLYGRQSKIRVSGPLQYGFTDPFLQAVLMALDPLKGVDNPDRGGPGSGSTGQGRAPDSPPREGTPASPHPSGSVGGGVDSDTPAASAAPIPGIRTARSVTIPVRPIRFGERKRGRPRRPTAIESSWTARALHGGVLQVITEPAGLEEEPWEEGKMIPRKGRGGRVGRDDAGKSGEEREEEGGEGTAGGEEDDGDGEKPKTQGSRKKKKPRASSKRTQPGAESAEEHGEDEDAVPATPRRRRRPERSRRSGDEDGGVEADGDDEADTDDPSSSADRRPRRRAALRTRAMIHETAVASRIPMSTFLKVVTEKPKSRRTDDEDGEEDESGEEEEAAAATPSRSGRNRRASAPPAMAVSPQKEKAKSKALQILTSPVKGSKKAAAAPPSSASKKSRASVAASSSPPPKGTATKRKQDNLTVPKGKVKSNAEPPTTPTKGGKSKRTSIAPVKSESKPTTPAANGSSRRKQPPSATSSAKRVKLEAPASAPAKSSKRKSAPPPEPEPEEEEDGEGDDGIIDCVCDIPDLDDGSLMVACDKCSVWYHARCIRYEEEMAKRKRAKKKGASSDDWVCPRCR